jgi:hypothetical protein
LAGKKHTLAHTYKKIGNRKRDAERRANYKNATGRTAQEVEADRGKKEAKGADSD